MTYGIAALMGYLLGCSNLAFFLARARGFDIRGQGSNNAGASNATITMGLKVGVLVALHDILKATLAALLAAWLLPDVPYIGLVAGVCAVLGHIFPFYLKGRGGKGFASFMGMVLALDWKFFLILAVLCLIVAFLTDYIIAATMTAIIVFPLRLICLATPWLPTALVLMLSAVIIYKHIPNFIRVGRGEELHLRASLFKKKTNP